ncbi:EscU/YscU/HrcU family type III secretion system export apparatus switch protein [Halomonas sp. ML-15]|uniref:EscU/YscU/HrcU family type III secretion system export apparatus switch protein n=1 Tax=Halomonas sp. ML-15 TaxID=2773305 RepID=UPI00174715BD|nr:EscU/YscU/HrcU family type III secretion system export apparatus switch protein [Halomonas sp. ML-15]MBD3894457.1 EscU/YscU/HrcU family type III secretion system export apparatus switch protein [Halomonas sp. ML-15]
MSERGRPRRRQAVALAYQESDGAPRVLARGYGDLAERIIAEARRQGLFVHDAPELVSLLMQLDIDERIPPTLYEVIAELLIWARELSVEEEKRQ